MSDHQAVQYNVALEKGNCAAEVQSCASTSVGSSLQLSSANCMCTHPVQAVLGTEKREEKRNKNPYVYFHQRTHNKDEHFPENIQ
jgi:hypothetical protein